MEALSSHLVWKHQPSGIFAIDALSTAVVGCSRAYTPCFDWAAIPGLGNFITISISGTVTTPVDQGNPRVCASAAFRGVATLVTEWACSTRRKL